MKVPGQVARTGRSVRYTRVIFQTSLGYRVPSQSDYSMGPCPRKKNRKEDYNLNLQQKPIQELKTVFWDSWERTGTQTEWWVTLGN